MNFRIFSKKHNLYTNSPLWPSNQRSTSDWFLAPNGDVMEVIDFEGLEFMLEHHDHRNFEVEPWTGYFDSKGRKIYRGDILKVLCFNLDYEVVWDRNRFALKALYDDYNGEIYPWPDVTVEHYEVAGNTHGIQYNN